MSTFHSGPSIKLHKKITDWFDFDENGILKIFVEITYLEHVTVDVNVNIHILIYLNDYANVLGRLYLQMANPHEL